MCKAIGTQNKVGVGLSRALMVKLTNPNEGKQAKHDQPSQP